MLSVKLKPEAGFEIRAYLQSCMSLTISVSQTENDLCQTQRTSVVSKM